MSVRRILVVGGVAGGASAAAKARRENERAEIHVFERGPYISFANCGLPYHISGEIRDRNQLVVMTPERFAVRSRIQAHIEHQVLSVDRTRKVIRVQGPDGGIREELYDKLILSQGARPFVPQIPGVDLPHVFTLRDIPDMDRILDALKQRAPERAVVIGGGFIGLEMAEAFLHRGMAVTLVEKNPHLLPLLDADMAEHLQEAVGSERLQFRFNAAVTQFSPQAVHFADGTSVAADMVLLSAGVRAEVELAREAGLEIGPTGGIRTNGRMETSDPDIYAVGDAAETIHAITGARTRIALAGPANRQGRVAGANAAGSKLVYPGALGTSIVRLLQMVVGFTGLSSRQAHAAGFTFFTSLTRDFSHAHYFPGAKPVLIKVIAEEGTGRLLGAQVIGEKGVDKRVDVLATAIMARMSVFELETLDLAYSPPFGSANDPVNVAGFVASHIARGDIGTVAPETWRPGAELLVDVRDLEELTEHGRLEGAIHIPLGELRDRVLELPKDRPIVTYCQKGQRGYFATCTLQGLGFDNVRNLRGGFLQARLNGIPLEVQTHPPAEVSLEVQEIPYSGAVDL
jgi:NADPH-dependent 2,4-dienoyl-CoA reductase/sulfur reductase-like enzyme/rhodanese-related sulfurtransferase